MRLKNAVWMLRFVLRKKWLWVLAVILAVYVVLVPYQKNLLCFFENSEAAKEIFWKSAYLFHPIFALVFLFQAAVQLLNTEAWELHRMWEKQMCIALGAVFLAYQILAIPAYAWYLSVYRYAVWNLFRLILTELLNGCIFYAVSVAGRKTMAGFIVVFTAILLVFGR